MRTRVFLLLIISCFLLPIPFSAQENAAVPARTPEQEASTQTERMQKELNLTAEQAQSVYDINLRHARERKVSNSRTQALERIKTKDEEIRQVLSRDQYTRLQDMRYDRATVTVPSTDRTNSERTINTQLRTRPVTPSSGNQAVTPGRTIPGNENVNPRNENNSRYVSPVNPNTRYSTPQNDNNTRYSVPQSPASTYRNSGSGTSSSRESGTVTRSTPSSQGTASPPTRQTQPAPTRQTQPSSSGSSSQPAQPSRSSGSSSGSSSQRR